LTITAIAPAVFFASVLSAYRGFFQGHQQMLPTAATQIVEQAFKLIIGFSLAVLWLSGGADKAAAGALVGVTLSEVAAVALILGMYARYCRLNPLEPSRRSPVSAGIIVKRLLPIAVPVMIGACVMPIVASIDNFLVMNRLQSIGYTNLEATSMFGVLSGAVNTMVNMPSVLTLALCVSLVPAIARAGALGQAEEAGERTRQGLKLAMLIGLPAAVGMAALAKPIMSLLYGSFSEERMTLAGNLLLVMAPGIFFLGIVQTLTGAIQGYGKVYAPVAALIAGAVCKIALSFTLLGLPSVNIYGAPVGTVVCYAVAAVIDWYLAGRYMPVPWKWGDLLARPALAAAGMGIFIWGFRLLAQDSLGMRLTAAAGVISGIVVYGILLVLLRGITPEEMESIPGGKRLAKLLWKGRHTRRRQ